jgi:regulator of sigma E protease
MTYRALGFMITGRLSMRESMTGPLGIFFITSKAASLGFIAVLHLMAVLSLSLAIFNLLPLPILDGGHIVFLGLEKIRGKPLGLKVDQMINKFGVAFIMSLAVFITYNDIVRNFGEKISKFFIK